MTRSEYLSDLRHSLRIMRNDVQKSFYFMESDQLQRRPAEGKWSIIEIFAHINIFQSYYLQQIEMALNKAPEVNHDDLKITWLGSQFIKSMKPVDGVRKMKVKTFRKSDPLYRAKQGIVLNDRIVFQDFINDIEELEEIIIKAYDRDISSVKVPTFIPFIKINIAEAIGFSLAHTERHIVQAKELIDD